MLCIDDFIEVTYIWPFPADEGVIVVLRDVQKVLLHHAILLSFERKTTFYAHIGW